MRRLSDPGDEVSGTACIKEAKVRGNLERIGEVPTELLDQIMHPAVGMDGEGMQPFRYRNKAQFPIGTDKDGRVIAGFYAGRTHSIIENTDCALGVEVNEEILNCILDFMEEFKIPAYDEVKHKAGTPCTAPLRIQDR